MNKNKIRFIFFSLLMSTLVNTSAYSQESSSSGASYSRFQISGELLGPGFLYNAHGSFRLMEPLAFTAGISTYSVTLLGVNVSLTGIPLYLSYFLGGESHKFEMLGGATLWFGSASAGGASVSSFALGPTFGIGYRYWPKDGGFHFRATLYALLASSSVGNATMAWPGLSFGYAF